MSIATVTPWDSATVLRLVSATLPVADSEGTSPAVAEAPSATPPAPRSAGTEGRNAPTTSRATTVGEAIDILLSKLDSLSLAGPSTEELLARMRQAELRSSAASLSGSPQSPARPSTPATAASAAPATQERPAEATAKSPLRAMPETASGTEAEAPAAASGPTAPAVTSEPTLPVVTSDTWAQARAREEADTNHDGVLTDWEKALYLAAHPDANLDGASA